MKQLIPFILLVLFGCTAQNKGTSAVENLYDYGVEQRLAELGIELQITELPPGIPIERATQVGDLLYLSGTGPTTANGDRIVGKVGAELSVEEGYQAARRTAINHLAVLKEQLGDLNRVVKVVKVLGMVNADPSFTEHPMVINGYSDLLIEVFGERGKHARSAVGVGSLPFNIACEVEMIVQVKE
jgi:enamine deaminase RidA (YjgF/YER057c/UK114 family)